MSATPLLARIVVIIDLEAPTPSALRNQFRRALRDAVMAARARGALDVAQTEELIRAISPSETRDD